VFFGAGFMGSRWCVGGAAWVVLVSRVLAL
jgi:hypothetical protein